MRHHGWGVAWTSEAKYDLSMQQWFAQWRKRHQHPVSRVLHAIAIPTLVLAGVLAVVQLLDWAWSLWWRPVGLVVVSYVLQWIGHRAEGNDLGELILIKRILGRPYVAVGPRYREKPAGRSATR